MRADTITKDFISDASVFADVFNYYIYGGEQVISPEQLQERDPVEIALPYGADGAVVPIQKFRDKQNLCAVMTDGELEYVLFGAEAQSEIQYAMPVKNNLYDALDYAGQVESAAKSHRREMQKLQRQREMGETQGTKGEDAQEFQNQEKNVANERATQKYKAPERSIEETATMPKDAQEFRTPEKTMQNSKEKENTTKEATELKPEPKNEKHKTPTSGEFLSGFWKEDKLIPSLTVTIYFGCETWDGPLSLFDMLAVKNPRVLSQLDNYRVHLIAPAQMADEEIMKLQSNLREVLFFIKYSKDKEKLDRILESGRERFQELERRAADVIKVITGKKLEYDESEVKVDMCQAIEDMCAEQRQLGREEERQKMQQEIADMREEEHQKMCQAIEDMCAEQRQLGREEERQKMSQAIADMRLEQRQLGREEERQKMQQEQQKTARNFYQMGLDVETISRGLNVSAEIIKQWIDPPTSDGETAENA